MKDYIVDASVVAKWLFAEPGSNRARLLIRSKHSLRAPDLILPEVLSVLLKRVVRGHITMTESQEVLQRFLRNYLDTRVRLVPSSLLAERALRIAYMEGRSSYDSLYLALAVQARCQLITSDDKLIEGIRDRNLKRYLIGLDDPALEIEIDTGTQAE
jgi:predicted nucleic acid-binding protein